MRHEGRRRVRHERGLGRQGQGRHGLGLSGVEEAAGRRARALELQERVNAYALFCVAALCRVNRSGVGHGVKTATVLQHAHLAVLTHQVVEPLLAVRAQQLAEGLAALLGKIEQGLQGVLDALLRGRCHVSR